MKVLLLSMPDVAPIIIHEAAIHMPNLGIASIAGNIDEEHQVRIADLIRKRRGTRKYVARLLATFEPDVVGLSAMAWQYDTCTRIIRLIKRLRPTAKIVIGGYHATLMSEEVAESQEAEDIDFMVRGEGEEACRRLINALAGKDRIEDIPGLSYKDGGKFVHNQPGELLDLSSLKLPIRDKRRLTWGYHVMYNKIEVMETSRGCTRNCSFCSMREMYGRSFRTFPIDRVLQDLDTIYYTKKTRWVFIADDNMVLDPKRVIELCEAIIARQYKGLHLVIQADCRTMAKEEKMVEKMAQAGCTSVFLGIENVSEYTLKQAGKTGSATISKQAVDMCHKYGMMVVGGLIIGFPDDDEQAIVDNFQFVRDIDVDGVYSQFLTPYPKTALRRRLLDEGLVSNVHGYKWYNGMWANVGTRHLSPEQLQYLFWYHKINVLGWWDPSKMARKDGKLWTGIWRYGMKPILQRLEKRKVHKIGWDGLYRQALRDCRQMNSFPDLEA
ncbi:MAG: B12-binding domain-containing radical SAM protein [Thermodesulfobacteriota bacterium]